MVSVRTEGITKRFGESVAVDNVTMEARDKEFVTLLGPSGCGKTTTLRIISGLVHPDQGDVYFGDENITDLPPYKRKIGFVFQRIALFPHMNIYKNVAFGLRRKHLSKQEMERRIRDSLELVRMTGFEKRMPRQLSGGQAQRVEIARVLATDPEVLLFDEPLSNLDAKLRDQLKYEIRGIQRETDKTAIYVTHDQAEAFAISDRIYVMKDGGIQQVGSPIELYVDPKTPFVADFIGTANFLHGRVVEVPSPQVRVQIDQGYVVTSSPLANAGEFKVNDPVLLSVRPEDIETVEKQDSRKYQNVVEGVVDRSTFTGLTTRLIVLVGNTEVKVDVQGPKRFKLAESQGRNVLMNFVRCTLIRARD